LRLVSVSGYYFPNPLITIFALIVAKLVKDIEGGKIKKLEDLPFQD